MAKDWSGPVGAIAGVAGLGIAVIALGFTAQQFFFGTAAPTKIDDIKGCNGFLIKDKPAILSRKAIPEEVEKSELQKIILNCRDEIRKNEKNAVAHTNIGEATRRLGDLPIALVAQQEALKLDPSLQEAKIGLGLVQADMGKEREANKTIQDTLTQKESAIAYYYQGVVFIQQKNLGNAESAYQKAINLNPDYADAYNGLGASLAMQGKTTEAISAFEKSINLNPNDVSTYTNLGTVLQRQGKTAEAIAAYQKAIILKPDAATSTAYSKLGTALDSQGKTAEAIAAFEKSISFDPSDGKTYNNLGATLYDQGKTAEAIVAFQKAISLKPDAAEAYGNLGSALRKQGKETEAIAAFQKAISLAPDNATLHTNLGRILLKRALNKQGKMAEAIATLQKARDLYSSQGNSQEANTITQILKELGSY